jgi:hypothetical protein
MSSILSQLKSQASAAAVQSPNPCITCLKVIAGQMKQSRVKQIEPCRFFIDAHRDRQDRKIYVAQGVIDPGEEDSILRCVRCNDAGRECYQVSVTGPAWGCRGPSRVFIAKSMQLPQTVVADTKKAFDAILPPVASLSARSSAVLSLAGKSDDQIKGFRNALSDIETRVAM